MHKIIIDNRVRLDPANISKSAIADLKREFEHRNPVYFATKARFGFCYYSYARPYDITWSEENGILTFPRGGLERIKKILETYEIAYEIEEQFSNPIAISFPDLTFKLYDYQERAMDACVSERIGIVSAPTGAGKTCTGLAIIGQLQIPFLIVCHSVALLKQWEERIKSTFSIGFEIGLIQQKVYELRTITLATAATLHKMTPDQWKEINSFFGGVILDECQFASASTFLDSIDKCKMPYRIGLSADYTRKDKKEFLTKDLFGGVISSVDKKELVNRSFVLDVHCILEPTNFKADWFLQQRIAHEMKRGKYSFDEIYEELLKTWPNLKPDEVPRGIPNYSKLIEEMALDNERNAQILDIAERMVNDGHRCMLFCHRVDHTNHLADSLKERKVSVGRLIGGPENKAEFQKTIAGLDSGVVSIGVGTYQAMGTGLDCPKVSRGIMATPIHGKQIWGQIRGRLCRTAPGKKDAEMVYMWDKYVFYNSTVKNHNAWNTLCSVNDGNLVSSKEYLRK